MTVIDLDTLLERRRKKGSRKHRPKRKWFQMKSTESPRKYFDMKSSFVSRKYNDDIVKRGRIMELEDTGVGSEYFLASSSLNDHYITHIVDQRTKNGLTTFSKKEELIADRKDWLRFVDSDYSDFQVVQFGEIHGMLIDGFNFVDYSAHGSSVEVNLYGDRDFIESQYKKFTKHFDVATCHIEWIYAPDGSSVNIPLIPEKLPISDMYPFLKDESIEEYYDRYLNSSASILLLIGPPGTGKTTFIRGLLNYAQKNAIVTYDEKILDRDYIFARFIEDNSGVMVIEDADNFLKSRADGNSMMHRFLNVGDGLISLKGKKMIFSTNLPSISDVDPALVRPGRCFDIVTFENYTKEQAKNLADKLDIPFVPKDKDSDTYSLAEIFFKQKNTNPKTRKLGFF